MTTRRSHALEATTSAVSWTIYEGDAFNIPRIDLVFATAPSSAGTVTITKDSVLGDDFDTTIRSSSAVGVTDMSFEGLHGFVNGDKIILTYDNPDNVSITGSASVELPYYPAGDLSVGGLTADAGTIRSREAKYAAYYHVELASSSPGGSGATWTPADANQLSGWLLNATGEQLETSTDIHGDWATNFNPEVEIKFTIQTDNTSGSPTDTVDITIIACYAPPTGTAMKTQTIVTPIVVGACDPYSRFHVDIDLNRNETDNLILAGDTISLIISVPSSGDLTAAVINEVAVYYPRTHVGEELAFV